MSFATEEEAIALLDEIGEIIGAKKLKYLEESDENHQKR